MADAQQYEQGRLRAISALAHKPMNKEPHEWLAFSPNAPHQGDHPDFVAGYNAVKEAVTPIDID